MHGASPPETIPGKHLANHLLELLNERPIEPAAFYFVIHYAQRVGGRQCAGKAGPLSAPRRLGWHLFRHSTITAHILQSGDIYKAIDYAGHASVQMTASTYAHLRPASVEEAQMVENYWTEPCDLVVTSPVTLRASTPN